MPVTIKAKFCHGVFEPLEDIIFPEGMELNITIDDKREPSQAYFWTKEWQEGEKEADKAKKAGDFHDFDNACEAFTWLKS